MGLATARALPGAGAAVVLAVNHTALTTETWPREVLVVRLSFGLLFE